MRVTPSRWRRPAAALVSAAAFALTIGCNNPAGPSEEEDALRAARARWNAARVTSYEMESQNNCFCPGTAQARVVVRDRRITSVVVVATEQTVPAAQHSLYLTVEQAFDLIQGAIDQQAVRIETRYDDTLGYPAEFFIDYQELVADEERGLTITSLHRLN